MAEQLRYAVSGHEFRVEQELKDLGFDPWVPRQLTLRRVPNKRERVAVEKPIYANYLFCFIAPQDMGKLDRVKHLKSTHHYLRRDDVKALEAYRSRVEADFSAAELKLALTGHLPSEYNLGDALRVTAGALQHTLGEFRKMVEVAGMVKYQVELPVLGKMLIDPVDIEKAG